MITLPEKIHFKEIFRGLQAYLVLNLFIQMRQQAIKTDIQCWVSHVLVRVTSRVEMPKRRNVHKSAKVTG